MAQAAEGHTRALNTSSVQGVVKALPVMIPAIVMACLFTISYLYGMDRPAPRGIPQIEVTFDIDANGIVHVSAQDKATGKAQSMTITGQSSLAKDDIDRMVRDAEAHAEDDKNRREEAEGRNSADTLVYQTEKLLKDQGEKFEGSEKEDVETALQGVKDALAGTNIEAIKDATEKLVGVSQSFSQRLYEQASASASAGGDAEGFGGDGAPGGDGSSESASDDDVVDAEIVDEQ